MLKCRSRARELFGLPIYPCRTFPSSRCTRITSLPRGIDHLHLRPFCVCSGQRQRSRLNHLLGQSVLFTLVGYLESGRGAMGVTYKALDVDLRCPVTLKVISERYLGDESARLRFLREAGASKPRRISQPKSGTLKAAEGPTSSLLAYKTLFLRSIQAPG